MRKVFLTSGVILCMACPAFADPQDINASGQITVDNNSVNAPCTEAVLSDVTQNATNAFEAKWTAKQYTIAYAKGTAGSHDNSYVTGSTNSTSPVTFESENISLANCGFSATGYHFTGWQSPVDLTDGSSPVSPATYVLYRGTQSGTNSNYTGGTLASYGYPSADPERTVTLTAQWTADQYTITYDPGQHAAAGVTSHDDTATFDTPYTALAGGTSQSASGIYPATGYNFVGWNTADDQTTANWSGISTWAAANAGNLTVYAAYTAKQYDISYGSGSHGSVPNQGADPVVYTDGLTYNATWTTKTFAETGIVADTGYTFTGWNTAADGTGTAYAANTAQSAWTTDAGLALYAIYSANGHSITYTCGSVPSGAGQGATITGDPTGDSNSNNNSTNIDYAGTYTLLTTAGTCALSGYHFGGWHCSHELATGSTGTNNAGYDYASSLSNNTYTVSATGSFLTDADVTCSVIWTPNSINLTWYDDTVENEGSLMTVQTAAQTCTYDGVITIPDQSHQPSKTGYTFTGWSVR